MNRPYRTNEDRSRRRKAITVTVIGLVVILGWFTVVAAIAGGTGDSQQGGAEGAASDNNNPGQEQDSTHDTANKEDEPTTGQGSSGEQDSSDGGKDSGTEQAESAEGGQPAAVSGADTGQADTGQVFDPLEEDSEQAGSTGGQQSEDQQPEGQQPEREAEPPEVDRTRARTAIERYVTAAYGYTGESKEDYLQAIEQAASQEIFDSPGGSKLEGYARAAPECGMRSTVILDEFEVVGQGEEGMDVSATFSVEDGSSDSSDPQSHTFTQDQRLVSSESSDGAYEVSAVSVEELISQTNPQESCPGTDSGRDTTGEDGETDTEPGGPDPTDEDRARSAADRYITSAYGYSGDSGEDYRRGISRTADTPGFYRSPGGEQVRDYAKAAGKDGISAAAVMESFEITSTEGSTVEGTAYFRAGTEYDRYGELDGEGEPFAIDLTLTPVNSAYEVSRAGAEREVSQKRISGSPEKKTR